MKRTLRWFFSVVIMLAVAVPAFSAQGVSSKSNKSTVFSYLTEEIGFNTAAACGIMANMEHESGFNPSRVMYDSNGLLSGGLCMWNGGRFSSLQRFCNNNGYNYLSIPGQLRYLEHELKSGYFKHIYNYLKKVPNTSSGAYDAAYYWCYYFEIPANRSYHANKRGSVASGSYWNKYSGMNATPKTPSLNSSSAGKTLDAYSSVKLTWSSGGSGATKYIVLVAPLKNGKYDFSSAKTYTVNGRSLTLKLSKLDLGRYAARVQAVNGLTGKKSAQSNTVKFKVACLKHDNRLVSSSEPTFEKGGRYSYVCKKCDAKTSKRVSKLNVSSFSKKSVSGFESAKSTVSSIKLKWNAFSGAAGYEVFSVSGSKTKRIAALSKNRTSYTVKKLSPSKKYTFAVRAIAKADGKTVYSKLSKLTASTAPLEVNVTGVARPGYGKVKLSWDKVKGADGYTVYISEKSKSGYKPVRSVSAKDGSYTVSSLKSGKCYYFTVKAYTKTSSGKSYGSPSSVKFAYAL